MVNVIVPLTMAEMDASCHSYVETQKSKTHELNHSFVNVKL